MFTELSMLDVYEDYNEHCCHSHKIPNDIFLREGSSAHSFIAYMYNQPSSKSSYLVVLPDGIGQQLNCCVQLVGGQGWERGGIR